MCHKIVSLFLVIVLFFTVAIESVKAQDDGIQAFDSTQSATMHFHATAMLSRDVEREISFGTLTSSDPFETVDTFPLARQGERDTIGLMSSLTLTHSGYYYSYKQFGEYIRETVQGYLGQKNDGINIYYDSGTQQRKAKELVGSTLTITQGEISKTWVTEIFVRVPASDLSEFSKSSQSAMTVIKRNMSKDDSQLFLTHESKGQNPLILVTCLWASNTKTHGWGSAGGRIVLIMYETPDSK
jgi:hypothetical protein